ncbi:voltage-dependent anion-selective channel-like [Anopheles arabiensis]|uniref:AGAP009833-PA n=4 Tax=gambiae species complex TaxID=44542 RepID=Q8T4K0_ANOGA|nr:voltage-dependent anion-selective channel-like [Anopheles arabiensis]XP_040235113.1 voltage-dependent anion-selective channel-like [Anopheles coluzzii]XP_041776357.1 voltage-dependent anion-selective channel-like [Anopheles merus]XP_318947.2 voltage-dependent anion-selective channel [Anopheles gambiae]EAA14314.2 AGAP009833-PA [Anopheles gambiae str. PEST]AAL89811.1 porin [Anopheles gambiae]AAN16031.1 porin [Anopheles gambiae]ABJ99082.1 voltage-dependent anion channel [Anopheles gambiae]
MAPPSYSDLGKQARDVFNKGYHFGLWKLDVKTKTNSGVEFSTSGHSNQDTGKVFGSLETKYKVKEYGLNFSEKWNTDNTLTSEVSVENQLVKGLKVSFDGMFVPHTGSKTGRFKTAYSHDRVRVDADFNVDLSGPLVNASGVAAYQGWLAGYQVAFDSQKSKITANNFALGYSAGDFVLHTNVNDGREFGGLIYQRCNDRLETAVQLSWASGSNATKFGMGAKYDLDKDACVRAKVNNQSQIGLGYQQKLRDGITLTLSTLVDGKNFNAGGHKIGVALELEA